MRPPAHTVSPSVEDVACTAALGGLAFAIFVPLAILTARFGRERLAWLPPHAALQLLAASMVVTAFALAVSQTGNLFADLHQVRRPSQPNNKRFFFDASR